MGAKVTLTVQELPAEMAPVQVLPLPCWKSRPGAPCVTTWTEPMVVVDAMVKVTGIVLLHGDGVLCPCRAHIGAAVIVRRKGKAHHLMLLIACSVSQR